MIYHYKMKQPDIINVNAGNGSRQSPWYWYSKTQGQTVNINNNGTAQEDGSRIYLRVKLNASTTYYIGETSPGGGDGQIWLYDQNYNELTSADDSYNNIAGIDCSDAYEYTPSTTGIYIIGAGSYSGYSQGDYTVAISPAPESDPVPDPQTIYYTSEGFDNWGKAIKYRSATLGNCNVLKIISGYIWGYKNGKIFDNNIITATNNGNITADNDGYFTYGNGKYFNFDSQVMTGNSARTFVLQSTISASNIQFIDGGSQSYNQMFGLGWGRNTDKTFYHFWSNDNASWLDLSPGSYILAFVYDGSVLTVYKDGNVLGTYNTQLSTGTSSNYRIGQYVIDDWYCTGEWKSNFCAVYDRALTETEIKSFKI